MIRICKHKGCNKRIPNDRSILKLYCGDHEPYHGIVHVLNLEENTYVVVNKDTGEILEKGDIGEPD